MEVDLPFRIRISGNNCFLTLMKSNKAESKRLSFIIYNEILM